MTLLEQLVPLLRRPPSVEDRRRAQRHLLDWLACAAAGAATPVGQRLAAYWRAESEPGTSTALGLGHGSRTNSVFYNACLGNVLEMDDVHRVSILHPGPIVIPVALEVGEQQGSSGAAILDAIIRGYEAVIRVGEALGAEHYRYWHTTSTAGAFGAAVAAASLRDLSDEQWLWALGNVGTRAGGLWQIRHEACDSKQVHNGWAAQLGLQATAAASAGIRGPLTALEGPQGLFAATAAGGNPEKLTTGSQGPWKIWECSFKPWAACRHAHPAIDAALQLQVKPEDIQRIQIASYSDALTFCDNPSPQTELAAKFSLQHAVAVTLLRGAPTLTDFDEGSRNDPAIVAMRERSEVALDGTLDHNYPQHYGATIRVRLKDGQELMAAVKDTLGDPERPLSLDALLAKYDALMSAGGYSESARAHLRECIDQLNVESSSKSLMKALAKPNDPEQV